MYPKSVALRLNGNIRFQVYDQVSTQAGHPVWDQVSLALKDQIQPRVYNAIYDQVYDQTSDGLTSTPRVI